MAGQHKECGGLILSAMEIRQQCCEVRFVFQEDSSIYYVKLYHKDKKLEVGGQVGRHELVWHLGRSLCQAKLAKCQPVDNGELSKLI